MSPLPGLEKGDRVHKNALAPPVLALTSQALRYRRSAARSRASPNTSRDPRRDKNALNGHAAHTGSRSTFHLTTPALIGIAKPATTKSLSPIRSIKQIDRMGDLDRAPTLLDLAGDLKDTADVAGDDHSAPVASM